VSFFDEADEPRRAGRARRAPSAGRGSGRRPPTDQQTLLVRRLIAAAAIVVVIILLIVLVKGCVDSRHEKALKDYNRNVTMLLDDSKNAVSDPLFEALQGAGSQPATQVQETINQLRAVADEKLQQAQRLDVPGDMQEAQDDFELVMSLRRDGVRNIADLIQPAISGSAAASDAIDRIAGEMNAFNASDVIYSQRVAPLLLRGLRENGVAASYDGTAGERVAPYSNFLPNIGWISPTNVARQLGASGGGGGSDGGAPAPGLHGHQLDSVSVGGVELTPGGSNELPASPPPTFTVTFTNGGEHDETSR
jgi:hypothetical protein